MQFFFTLHIKQVDAGNMTSKVRLFWNVWFNWQILERVIGNEKSYRYHFKILHHLTKFVFEQYMNCMIKRNENLTELQVYSKINSTSPHHLYLKYASASRMGICKMHEHYTFELDFFALDAWCTELNEFYARPNNANKDFKNALLSKVTNSSMRNLS